MTFFMQSGDTFAPTAGRDSMLNSLPVGNYIVIDTMMGMMFKRVDSFGDPGRMYGNINKRAERIMNTFMDRPRTTGVLLSGEKGSGKSQLARNVSRLGYEQGIPTILVNAPFAGDAFNSLLASIEQPAIILMDEFEKVYSEQEQQEQVLTLLDGMMTSKKLFVMTVNNKYRVNEHMKNRPGRIFYALDFAGLEPEFIREYCDDNLADKTQIENVMKISAMFSAFNFDMLKAMVEEMNRYDESAFEAVEMLNAKPFETGSDTTYEVVVTSPNGVTSVVNETTDIPLGGGRSRSIVYTSFEKPDKDFDLWKKELAWSEDEIEESDYTKHFVVEGKALRRLNADKGVYEFTSGDFTVVYTRKEKVVHDLRYLDF